MHSTVSIGKTYSFFCTSILEKNLTLFSPLLHSAKHFIDTRAFEDHVKGKPHKRRMNALKTEPYTIEESERAAGMGSYHKPQKRKIETMFPEAMKKDDDTDQSNAKKAKMETMLPEVMKIDGDTEEIAEMKP